jgi:hypothetical protein
MCELKAAEDSRTPRRWREVAGASFRGRFSSKHVVIACQ